MTQTETEHLIHLSWDRTIDRPISVVFDVLTDLETYLPAWAKGPIAVRKETPGRTDVGTKLTVVARVAAIRVRGPYEVTRWHHPDVFGGRGVAGPFRFDEEYRLAAISDSRTMVHYEIGATPRGPLRIVRGPLTKQLRTLIDGDLDRFKQLVESQ